ncbi:hypothetical protein [Janthinobacterium sp.]|uniref:hypothetical protein n=1 Tax=Janthinobacterium sp. TaxID=1871054 RepID=UPI00261CC550|nr:hypothetical protein [Janthinobacterium sp.]
MITFLEFLNEDTNPADLTALLRECMPFIRQSKGAPIYRGLSNPTGGITIDTPEGELTAYRMPVRTDRRPLHTDQYTHSTTDWWLNSRFGWRPRSSGLFVTGRSQVASIYGPTYIILPRGNFHFVWSPDVQDLMFYQLEKGDDNDTVLAGFNYQNTDLESAIQSGNEIMIGCRDFYAIPSKDSTREMIRQAIWDLI